MTPRDRVEKALRGGHADKVPFTAYECLISTCTSEREMRNRGLCIVNRRAPVLTTHRPNVKTTQRVYSQGGRKLVRTLHETPVGAVWTIVEPAGFTSWQHEKMFKGPEDYKTILFLIQDEQYEPCYGDFVEAEAAFGPDAIFRVGIGYEPLQALISGEIMDMEDFCTEWMDRRDEVLKLYRAIVENRRKVYPLIADSPAGHANYGGNVVSEVIGPEVFAEYYVPHYDEAAEALHARGKLIGCHFDGNCRILAEAIAQTDLDYVEAFTPSPDSDMTLGQARAAWPNKTMWINFPSSLHLQKDAQVLQAALDLIDQAGSPDGLLLGITEDMPPGRWQNSCRAIMDGIDQHAQANPGLYSG